MKRYNSVRHHVRRQTGGTFLGLILGLIIGLAIAVVVALMITKSPIPFVNKVIRQERTELSPGQTADPNKPLYGKDSVVGDNSSSVAEPPQNQAALPPERAKPEVAPAPVVNVDTSSKAGAKEQSHTGDNAVTSPVDEKWVYFLQTGAFHEQADAESARAKLALLGFEAQVSQRSIDSGSLYRVRIGPMSQMESVNRMRSKLSENGVDSAVVRIAK